MTPTVTTLPCPVCNEPVSHPKGWGHLNREIRIHLVHAHREELAARLDNPHDSVIAKLWDEFEISFRKKDLI